MPLDFPASPSTGQTYAGPGGAVWSWDGAKWVNGTASGTAYAPIQINVKTFGAKGDGTTNDTVAIQAALDAVPANGAQVVWPPGNYIINATLFIPSHTFCYGPGATITAGTGFVGGGLTNWAMMANKNYPSSPTSSYTLDTDIHFQGLSFSYVNKQSVGGGGTHAIRMYGVTLVRVYDCFFNYGNDATAFIHCDDTAIEMCRAINIENAAYDHWASPRNVRVVNNYASNAATWPGAAAVLFNAGTGDGHDASFAQSAVISNNVFYGSIGFDTLTDAGTCSDLRITDNYISNPYAIIGRGTLIRTVASGNTISGSGPAPAIWIDADATGSPSDTTVVGNVCTGLNVAPVNIGGVRLFGGGIVSNNRISGTYQSGLSLSGGTFYGSGNSIVPGTGSTISGTLLADSVPQLVLPNGGLGFGQYDASGALTRLTLQSDNNHIFYGTDATGATRSIFSITQRSSTSPLTIQVPLRINGTVGFNNTGPIAKPTITGAKGSNAALASLLTALVAYGLITDTTTA